MYNINVTYRRGGVCDLGHRERDRGRHQRVRRVRGLRLLLRLRSRGLFHRHRVRHLGAHNYKITVCAVACDTRR